MHAEILSIGDELLIGQVVNTNASYIASQLDLIGVPVNRIIALGDDSAQIKTQLQDSLSKSDIVITTGGLGPTHDDITKKTIADFFQKKLVFDQQAYDKCKLRFQKRGISMPKSNASQAEVIEGSYVIQNNRGTAPGMILHDLESHPKKYVVVLPGVPYEMQEMMIVEVAPYFKSKSSGIFKHTVLMTAGIGESTLAEQIGDVGDFLDEGTSLAYLPQSAGVKLRLTSKGTNESDILHKHEKALKILTQKIGRYLYATSDMPLEACIGSILTRRKLKLAVAESCTGGLISHRLTNIPGSSHYFIEGIVSYANESKIARLGVNPKTLEQHGAVSEQVALEMAKGCLERSDCDIAVSTTGIAGPGGGTERKPVGMICFAIATGPKLGKQTLVKTMNFTHERIRNKERFSETALHLIHELLTKSGNCKN